MQAHLDGNNFDLASARKISIRPGRDSHQELYQSAEGDYFLIIHRLSLPGSSLRNSNHLPPGKTSRHGIIHDREVVPLSPLVALEWCLQTHIPQELHNYLLEYLASGQSLAE